MCFLNLLKGRCPRLMTITYPPRLSLAHTPTPLVFLDRLSQEIAGPRIWVKRDDLTGCAVSGNKIRKLEFTLARALQQGCDTIITGGGVQSNHCRTTALLCAQLGLRCHLLLRGEDKAEGVDGNLLLDRLAGAEISFYPNKVYVAQETELFQEWQDYYAARNAKAYTIPIGASDGTGLWGYIAACDELVEDFKHHGIAPPHIVCATGSGGTQAGLTVGSRLCGLDAQVWGINVCDDEQYFLNKVRHDINEWCDLYNQTLQADELSIKVIDGYVGAGYARASSEVFETIKLAASVEGLILDPVYTGKAFHGMIEEIKGGRFADADDIVFLHTGGIFGLFPQREQLGY